MTTQHRQIFGKGQYVTISSRDLKDGGYRVRVKITDIAGNVAHDVHKDFTDIHEADSAYIKQISKYEILAGLKSE